MSFGIFCCICLLLNTIFLLLVENQINWKCNYAMHNYDDILPRDSVACSCVVLYPLQFRSLFIDSWLENLDASSQTTLLLGLSHHHNQHSQYEFHNTDNITPELPAHYSHTGDLIMISDRSTFFTYSLASASLYVLLPIRVSLNIKTNLWSVLSCLQSLVHVQRNCTLRNHLLNFCKLVAIHQCTVQIH